MLKFRDSVFQKLFAIIALIASLSLVIELKALFLDKGIAAIATNRYQALSLFNLDTSNGFIYLVLAILVVSAAILAFNPVPNRIFRALVFLMLYISYLSFVNYGQPFLNFQWDALLLETAFLFVVYFLLSPDTELSKINIWLFRILVFKLMFMSGIVKLTSGDITWQKFTALDYHYFTQPLPNSISFFVHQLPSWFHKLSCIVMFIIELIVPFFIFCGKRAREIAGWSFIALQIIIFLTGNYGFFNLLTIVLCFSIFDFETVEIIEKPPRKIVKTISIIVLSLYSLMSLAFIGSRLSRSPIFTAPIQAYVKSFGALHICNPYGLFAMMTKKRGEIIIQGAADIPGQMLLEWKDYKFRYKPQDIKHLPAQIAPLQPRLDWQMWFAALSDYKRNPWLITFAQRLLENEEDVLKLFETNPFAKRAPSHIRALYYEYEFNDLKSFWQTKEIWKRTYKGVYLPELSLRKKRARS